MLKDMLSGTFFVPPSIEPQYDASNKVVFTPGSESTRSIHRQQQLMFFACAPRVLLVRYSGITADDIAPSAVVRQQQAVVGGGFSNSYAKNGSGSTTGRVGNRSAVLSSWVDNGGGGGMGAAATAGVTVTGRVTLASGGGHGGGPTLRSIFDGRDAGGIVSGSSPIGAGVRGGGTNGGTFYQHDYLVDGSRGGMMATNGSSLYQSPQKGFLPAVSALASGDNYNNSSSSNSSNYPRFAVLRSEPRAELLCVDEGRNDVFESIIVVCLATYASVFAQDSVSLSSRGANNTMQTIRPVVELLKQIINTDDVYESLNGSFGIKLR